MKDLLGHIGAWAPRPEQVATAEMLRDEQALRTYGNTHRANLQARLDRLHEGLSAMAASGLPVRDIPPQGAIYLSIQFDLIGRRASGPTMTSGGSAPRGGLCRGPVPGLRSVGRERLVPVERRSRLRPGHRRGPAEGGSALRKALA